MENKEEELSSKTIKRKFSGRFNSFLLVYIVAGALFHIYSVVRLFPESIWYYCFHVCYFLILAFALFTNRKDEYSRTHINIPDIINIILVFSVFIYMSLSYKRLIFRMVYLDEVNLIDLLFGIILVYLIFSAVYRVVGKALLIVSSIMLLYAYFGNYLSGRFEHQGFSVQRIVEQLSLYTDGIYGLPVAISATFVFMFIIFGSFLTVSGAGSFIFELSQSIVGGTRGGIAKISVISSALFGTISGSPIANVCVTGAFTIPSMKRAGYSPVFAGAVEAIASTGGCIMPPVMGAVAFLMAEILGIPYIKVCIIAALPAILYYLVLFVYIDIRSVRLGLKGLPQEDLPKISIRLMKRGITFFGSIFVLVWLLAKGWSPTIAAFGAIIAIILMGLFIKENRVGFKKMIMAFDSGVRSCIPVALIMACTGIVIGMLNLTGFGIKIGSLIFAIGGNNMFSALFLSMVVCLILGMGMNITPAYLITVVIAGPSLIKLGIFPIAAHLFIVYFAALAGVTPPIAVTSFTAAGISGADPMKTGIAGVKLGLAGFVVPYLFVYNNALLMQGSPLRIILTFIITCLSMFALLLAVEGWWSNKISVILRILLAISGLLILPLFMNPIKITSGIILLIIVSFFMKKGRERSNV